MNNQRKNEIKVGLVSILAIALLLIGISLGRSYSVSVSTQTIKFRFPNSGGIQLSSPVVVNGVKRGNVSFVKNDNNSVLIEATIDDVSDLKKDASAIITILEITGGKKIEINPGKSNIPLDINLEIPGRTGMDLADIVTNGGDMLYDAKVLIKKLDTISSTVNKLFESGKHSAQIKQIVQNTDELIATTRDLLGNNKDELNTTIKNLNLIAADVKSLIKKDEPKLDSLLSKLDNTLKSTKVIVDKAELTLSNVDVIISDIKNITNEIKNGDGFISKVIYDKNTSAKLDSTVANLTELLSLIRQYGINVNVRLGTRP